MRFVDRLPAVFGFLGVALGAFGAHKMKEVLSPEMLAVWQTAVLYQLVHAVAGLVVAGRNSTVIICWSIGTLFFSGSLYMLALTNIKWLGAITPFGGALFLAGWAVLVFKPARNN